MKLFYLHIAVVLMIWSNSFADHLSLTVATGEFPPYVSKKIENNGFLAQIVSQVFNDIGYRAEIRFFPWKRCELHLKSGQVQAAFPYLPTQERQKWFQFSDSLIVSTGKFFYCNMKNKRSIRFESIQDLKAYRIGGVMGYWYQNLFSAHGLHVEYAPTEKMAFKWLVSGRVDLVPADSVQGFWMIDHLFPDQRHYFETLEKPLNKSELRLMMAKSNPGHNRMIDLFNTALINMKKQGRYLQILNQYGIHDNKVSVTK